MAVLSAEERRRTWGHLMRSWSAGLGGIPVNKSDLRAAVDATDDWIEANQASFNSALPQPFRGAASTPVKTLLFCYVAMRRAGLLRAEEDGS
jgi:hypothetical protein